MRSRISGTAGIGKDASIAEGARTVFHPASVPGDDVSIRDETGRARTGGFKRIASLPLDLAVEALKGGNDGGIVVFGSEERSGEAPVRELLGKRGAIERGSESNAVIAGDGLHVDFVEKS